MDKINRAVAITRSQLRQAIAAAGLPAERPTDEQLDAAADALADIALRSGIFALNFCEAFNTAIGDPRVREAYLGLMIDPDFGPD